MIVKNFLKIIALGALLVTCAAGADSIPEGAYVAGKLGISSPKSINNSSLPIVSTINIEMTEPDNLGLNLKRGMNYSIALGTQIYDFRFELEGLRMRSKYKDLTMNQGENNLFSPLLTGAITATSGLGNVYYDLNILNDCFVPYIGGGAGISRIKNHIEFELMEGQDKGNMLNTVFAYHGTVGISLYLTETVAATFDYRYFSTAKVKALEKSFNSHLFNLGLIYRF